MDYSQPGRSASHFAIAFYLTLFLLLVACGSDSSDVDVTPTHALGGTIENLQGEGFTLLLTGNDELTELEAGTTEFSLADVKEGAEYQVVIADQPTKPKQQCALSNASGVMADGPVDDIKVRCTTENYHVGGELTGLFTGAVTIQLNDGQALTLDEDGEFRFDEPLKDASSYNVTVLAQPSLQQSCQLRNHTGTLQGSAVNDIELSCPPVLKGYSEIMRMALTWESHVPVNLLWSSDPDCDWDNYANCANSGMDDSISGGQWQGRAVEERFRSDLDWYFVLEQDGMYSNQLGLRPAAAAMDDNVWASATGNGRVYLGGDFEYVGAYTGSGVIVSQASGDLSGAMPFVDGEVHAVVADGTGGWYIGGDFETVGDYERAGIARIRPDGSVHPAWNPGANDTVKTMARANGRIYVGGAFSLIGGELREYLVAFNEDDGQIDAQWSASANGPVHALLAASDRVYVGGDFTRVRGEIQHYLAAVSAEDGELVSGWRPAVAGPVNALTVAEGNVFAAGEFQGPDFEELHLAAIGVDDSELVAAWELTGAGWGESPTVNALAAAGNTVYVGGDFEQIDGEARARLGAIHAENLEVLDRWKPGASGPVNALTVAGGRVYAGGDFDRAGGEVRNRLAAFDALFGHVDDHWTPGASEVVNALALSGEAFYAGGDFTIAGRAHRRHLAAFRLDDGTLDANWNPLADERVQTIVEDNGVIYIGGRFDEINDEPRPRLAALDGEDGSPATHWEVTNLGTVRSLTMNNRSLYAAAMLDRPDSGDRDYLAEFDMYSGYLLSWTPRIRDFVLSLDADDDRLYVGGVRRLAHRTPECTRMVAFDLDDGNRDTDWEPCMDGEVRAVHAAEGLVFAGGAFLEVDEEEREHFATFNAGTGELNSDWTLGADGWIEVFESAGGRLFVGGSFSHFGDSERHGLAAFDLPSGSLDSTWVPAVGGTARTLTIADDKVFVGGFFSTAKGNAHRLNFAVFDLESGELLW